MTAIDANNNANKHQSVHTHTIARNNQRARPRPQQQPQQKKKTRYIMQRTLGRGAFGTVYLTKQESTDNYYAVKETFQNARYKNREADILKIISHPAIVKVHQIFYTEKKDGTYLNIVMEYLPASLHDVIQKHAMQGMHIPEMDIKYYMFQLSRACAYLSRRKICHRDIKPQNIIVNPKTKQIRLCDFGSAKKLNDGEWNKHYICSRFYRAPELLCESNYYSPSVDTWSLGCVMAEMYLNEPLFNGGNTREQLKLISRVLGPLPPNYPYDEQNHKQNNLQHQPQNIIPIDMSSNVADDKHINNQNAAFYLNNNQWKRVLNRRFESNVSVDACDFIKYFVCYLPSKRINLLECLMHNFMKIFAYNFTQEQTNGKNNLENISTEIAEYPIVKLTDDELSILHSIFGGKQY